MSYPDQWYLDGGGEPRGPFSMVDLQQQARERRLSKTTLVWAPGMGNWVPAGEVKEIWPTMPPPLPTSAIAPPPIPQQQPYTEPNKRSFSFFEKPTTEVEALKAVKDGATAGYLLAGAYVLTAFLTASSGTSLTTGRSLSSGDQGDTVFIMVVLAGVAIGLALWVRQKASLVGLIILCAWFSIEVLAKLAAFATYPNAKLPAVWFAVYLGILGAIITAIRGAMFLRRMRAAR